MQELFKNDIRDVLWQNVDSSIARFFIVYRYNSDVPFVPGTAACQEDEAQLNAMSPVSYVGYQGTKTLCEYSIIHSLANKVPIQLDSSFQTILKSPELNQI
jgi:hypothetical protein